MRRARGVAGGLRLPRLWAGPLVGAAVALPWRPTTAPWLLLGAGVGYLAEVAATRVLAGGRTAAGRAWNRLLVSLAVLGVIPLLALGGMLPLRRVGPDALHLLAVPVGAALLAAVHLGSPAGAGGGGEGERRWTVVTGGFLVTALVGALDAWVPPPFALELLYLVPVLWVTGYAGRSAGALAALLSAEAHGVVRGLSHPGPLSPLLSLLDSVLLLAGLVAAAALFGSALAGIARETAAARTDLLTGLINRKAFLERMAAEVARAARHQRPLSLAYLDLDGFKGVNDRAGHAAGDEVLRIVAGVLRTSLRAEDIPARLGGDEFAVLLPETGTETAARVVERLRQQVEERMRAFDWPVTCSVGVVTSAAPGATVEDLVRRADELMYEVKHGGKNALRQAVLSR